jgi:hypothetical protein
MNLDGKDIEKLRDAIVKDCYQPENFREILRIELDFIYDNIEKGDDFLEKVFNTIDHFNKEGEEPFWKFIAAICKGKPDNKNLQETCESIRKKYQLIPPVIPDQHLKDVANSLKEGKLIFFLGSGINLSDDNLEQAPQFSPSDKRIAYALSDRDTRKPRELIGFPCEICPYKNRPQFCPVIIEIEQNKGKKQQLMKEQDLAFAKLEIKCNAQYNLFSHKNPINTGLTDIYENDYAPNKVQELLANIVCLISEKYNKFPLIITTNYDCGIEKAFEKKGQDIDILYYAVEVDSKAPRDIKPKLKFISYKIQDNNNAQNKSYQDISSKEIKEINPETGIKLISEKSFLVNCPMIVRLYGGDIYKFRTDEGETDNFECSFALAGINSPRDLSDKKTIALPLKIPILCRSNNILFLGYSATDSELRDVLDYLISPSDCRLKDSKGWLIHQSDIGKLNVKVENYWKRQYVKLDIEYMWEEYMQKLHEYIQNNLAHL